MIFQCHYEPLFVALSYTISVLGAYCALGWAAQIPSAGARARPVWLTGAAVAMGGGAIWSMHFIAMLACRLPVPVDYDVPVTLASLMIAVIAAGGGLAIASRGAASERLLAAGVVTGLGAAAAHYTGIAAMHLPARPSFRPELVTLSVLIALVAGTASLWMAFRAGRGGWRLAASLLMAGAVCGMHYAGMAALVFRADGTPPAPAPRALLDPRQLAVLVFGVTLCVLLLLWTGGRAIERKRREESLRRSHHELEALVEARTATLARLNRELSAEIAERDRSYAEGAQLALSLRSSEALTRSIIEGMREGLVTLDADNVIRTVNASAVRLFGYSRRELVGEHISRLIPDADGKNVKAFLKDGRLRGMGRLTDWRGLRKNGSTFPFELSLFEFWTPEGRYFGGVIKDLSEREELDRLKREFVSTVSHELRTPLTSVRGALGLVAGGAAGVIPAQARSLLDIAVKNCERLARLVDDILDFEKVESGELGFKMEDLALAPLLGAAADGLRSYAAQYSVTLAVEDAAPGMRVRADADRFTQVLANLLSNAVKFSPPGETVELTARPSEGGVRLEVVDHGPGIPEEFRSRIFGRFQQADASDTRQRGGTGLGLAITRRIVDLLGGTLGFETEVGRGSTFWIELPAAAAREPLGTRPMPVVVAEMAIPAMAK